MTSPHKLLLGLLLLLILGLGVGWKLLGSGQPEKTRAIGGGAPVERGVSDIELPTPEVSEGPRDVDLPIDAGPTYEFAHPLKIELDLVRASSVLSAEGAAPQGHGHRAKIRGSLHGPGGKGVVGDIVFVDGANRGRVIRSESNGLFGANDLYPGLSIIEIDASGHPPAMREVLLRNNRESLLNIGFGRLATVYGEVVNQDGDPLPYATVTVDGQKATTDEEGVFYFPRMASGQVLAVVRKPGFTSYREMLNITANRTIEIGQLKFALRPAATLKVTVQERIGARGDALLFIEPSHDYKNPGSIYQRKYPWHLVSPVSITPGSTITIEDLPAIRVRLRLVHAGAVAKPATKPVDLIADRTKHVVLHLEPTEMLRGVVTRDGEPVHKAKVTLEVPDVAMGTAEILGGPMGLLEAGVMQNLPPAIQTAWTSGLGEFAFSPGEDLSGVRYLTATSPDGEAWAGRVIQKGDRQVELKLERRIDEEVVLTIDSLPRKLVLPVEIRIDGAPLDITHILPEDDMVIPGLSPGTWKVRVTYRGEEILRARELDFEAGDASLMLEIPLELREGPPSVAAGS